MWMRIEMFFPVDKLIRFGATEGRSCHGLKLEVGNILKKSITIFFSR